jgi:hypothetical protein
VNKKNLTFYRPKYRFNPFLQGLDIITFSRNPYYRFVSSYIDKHILKDDLMYLNIQGYKNFIQTYPNNIIALTDYISKNNYISDHYLPIYQFDSFYYIIDKIQNTDVNEKKHNLQIFPIESSLNNKLYEFLSKYHLSTNDSVFNNNNNSLKDLILNTYDNSLKQKINIYNSKSIDNICPTQEQFHLYTSEEWEIYLKSYCIDYDKTLVNELKEKIYDIYKNDFILFNYTK